MKMAVCIFIRNPDEKVLAVSRKDDPKAFGLPGGKVDPGETNEEAAVRELEEETGIVIRVKDLVEVLQRVCEGDDDYDACTYQVEYNESMENPKSLSSAETGLVKWVSWEDLLTGPFGIYNKQLKEIVDASEGE